MNNKKLLIITQKVNKDDPILGFFHRWIEEFAIYFGKITVICLEKGEYRLPTNVQVFSLGKEKFHSRFLYILKFYKYIVRERKNYDAVFVHMNPEYIVLGGLFWRLLGKRISLWYTHKTVNLKLRIAVFLSSIVFTASAESLRMKSDKVRVLGHGIDLESFLSSRPRTLSSRGVFSILSVGRLSRVKGHGVIIQALSLIDSSADLTIVGGPVTTDDQLYFESIKREVEDAGLSQRVHFIGEVSPVNMYKYYENADVFVNASSTGSLDKTILEAMLHNLPVLSSNDAAVSILSKFDPNLIFSNGDSATLARSLEYVLNMSPANRMILGKQLHEEVVRGHALDSLIKALSSFLMH